ncbi:MAG TPA: SDR family oxidoreductase [Gemmataceae bacterium]|nr:SDR family oxidoreductase [Gemmataceae bacterium]
MKLEGKVALVTGASAGIGRATALALAQEGADVALNYLTWPESAEELAAQIRALGRKTLLCPVDVSDQAAVEAMVAQVLKELGRLDILVTCAVYADEDYFYRADMAGVRRTVDVTLWGTFYALRAAANAMIRQGQGGNIVLVSSIHARMAIPTCAAYNMAKAALDQLGRTAALELAPHRIRVNLMVPGWTDTPGERKYFSEEALLQGGAQMPLGRLARPEEIARGILFLVDPASEYVTGSALAVDGGGALPWWSKRGEGTM